MNDNIKLTQYAHGAGCGCKIDAAVLNTILAHHEFSPIHDPKIIVGNSGRDDASVIDLGNEKYLISTTDFFTPIVDDAFMFGQIAASNALSDVYAMGGKPEMALAILGWPLEKLGASLANQVMQGAREKCKEAGIYILGGHSIDAAEPFFGLMINGTVHPKNLKKNNTVQKKDVLYLSKPIGTGLITTAHKFGKINENEYQEAISSMCLLNQVPEELLHHFDLHALTDVTGFGVLGHVHEMLNHEYSAELYFENIPILSGVDACISQMTVPGATYRNWNSVSASTQKLTPRELLILCDPQTSGGLLFSIAENSVDVFEKYLQSSSFPSCAKAIGRIIEKQELYVILK